MDIIMDGVLTLSVQGVEPIGDVKAYHLHFSQADIDWDMWIQEGKQPLVRKVSIEGEQMMQDQAGPVKVKKAIVTSFDDWKINAPIPGEKFVFTPPADTPDGGFAALTNQGFGAEIRWNVDDLHVCIVAKPECNNMPGTASTDQTDPKLSDLTDHIFRIYFMVHDGDQHQSGGDVGHNCATVFIQ